MKDSIKMFTVILTFSKRKITSKSKTKGIILLSLIVTSVFIFWTDFKFYKSDSYVALVKNVISGNGKNTIGDKSVLIIKNYSDSRAKAQDVQACAIPQTPIMPEYFKVNWQPNSKTTMDKHDCSYEQNVAKLEDEQTLILLEYPVINQSCCLQEIKRGDTDFLYNFTDCTEIQETTKLDNDIEAFAVRCGNSTNVDTTIPITPKVQKKIEHWREISSKQKTPISVIFFGFDSVSRSHAYRSLPDSIELMKQEGFIDFEGYHSIAPSTLTNFMGFLMGMTRTEVRLTCAPDWTAPFDTCPFIWKQFHRNNYVTSYIEDGLQTFNWGGQSGFVEKPTDYYLHHLFLALQNVRQTQVANFHLDPRKKNLTLDCTSNEKIPEFLLRYTQRFVHKFAESPFFSFTWFAYPFHEDIYSLSLYDEQLVSFIQSITTHPHLLDNTMIIFLSDHGDRTSFFNSKSIESYIERGFPPLFIRPPNSLTEKYPEMTEALRHNSKLLATPFDVHHTLLHVLSMSSPPKNSQSKTNFIHKLKDRSSLLVKITENRTCADTNIPPTNCLCNVQFKKDRDDSQAGNFNKNDRFVHRILRYSISQLNRKVSKSEYRDDCEKWTSNPLKDIIYTKKISQSTDYIEILIAFTANPGLAKFEARLKLFFGTNVQKPSGKMKVVGFSRINQYGTQSWCVKSMTDSDKEMKEICMCKVQNTIS